MQLVHAAACTCSFLLTPAWSSTASERAPPATFLWDGPALLATLEQSRQPDAPPQLKAILFQLGRDADAASAAGPWSVMQKPLVPASGDKHDYMSLGSISTS